LSEVMRVRVSIEGKIAFEVSGVNLECVQLKVYTMDREVTVALTAGSLLDLLDKVRFAAESVISKLERS